MSGSDYFSGEQQGEVIAAVVRNLARGFDGVLRGASGKGGADLQRTVEIVCNRQWTGFTLSFPGLWNSLDR